MGLMGSPVLPSHTSSAAVFRNEHDASILEGVLNRVDRYGDRFALSEFETAYRCLINFGCLAELTEGPAEHGACGSALL